jgi:hypothetical protein
MPTTLKDVGRHCGTSGDGHYEAAVHNDGSVEITTVFDNAQQAYTVYLSNTEWDRLVAWVEWQRKK